MSELILDLCASENKPLIDKLSKDHDSSEDKPYNTLGVFKCCNVTPKFKNTNLLSTFYCPVCNNKYSCWTKDSSEIIPFNGWNGKFLNTFASFGDTSNQNRLENLKNIEGYSSGWRYIQHFYFYSNKFRFKAFDDYYNTFNYISEIEIPSKIVRYDVDNNIFEIKGLDGNYKFEYNPPKSGGSVAYQIKSSCLIDNGKEHKYNSDITGIYLYAFNYKWTDILADHIKKINPNMKE